jgi:hypothetical protein
LIVLALVSVARVVVSNANSRFNLCLRVRKRQHQRCQQCKMFHVTHIKPLVSTVFELGSGEKVARTGVAHFSHPD